MKTLIGIVTFGNLPFTQLTINEIRATTKSPVDFLVIVGKPGDHETAHWLEEQGIVHLLHHVNKGFPESLNDIWDYAWNTKAYDNVILAGNDIVPYPNAVDALIEEAARGEWEWICSSQFDVNSLVTRYPEARKFFEGDHLRFTDFTARPWELHNDIHAPRVEPGCLKDVQNLCLYRRSVFEKLGYFDANFWPNGYFSDNDYCRRANLSDIKACGLAHSAYFHFWSRTIHQGERRPHDVYFARNQEFYQAKWGGGVNGETFVQPFNGSGKMLTERIALPTTNLIATRAGEDAQIQFWSAQL